MLTSTTPSWSADDADKARKKELKQKVKGFDADGTHELSATEREALRKAFATDPALKALDKNGDGQLDDAEISAVNLQKSGGKLQGKKLDGSGKLMKKK